MSKFICTLQLVGLYGIIGLDGPMDRNLPCLVMQNLTFLVCAPNINTSVVLLILVIGYYHND